MMFHLLKLCTDWYKLLYNKFFPYALTIQPIKLNAFYFTGRMVFILPVTGTRKPGAGKMFYIVPTSGHGPIGLF
jgi:type 1 glutamine amidotransferase